MIIVPALMLIIPTLMAIIIMVLIITVTVLMRLLMPAVVRGSRRRGGLPAVAAPVHATIITLAHVISLMAAPPLWWTPVVTIPIVSALILISEVNRNAGDIDVNGHACLCDDRQCQYTTKQ